MNEHSTTMPEDAAATAEAVFRKPFQLEEATIDEMHAAIKAGRDHRRPGRAAIYRPGPRL